MSGQVIGAPPIDWAAGGVLWRPATGHNPGDRNRAVQVAVVHRPRYDDWSLPKGHTDPGEALPTTAVREIAEETGYSARLVRHLGRVSYEVLQTRKRVDYWSARVTGGDFSANDEVDQLRWVSPEKAQKLVNYAGDRKVLRSFGKRTPLTQTLIIVRHAKAGRSEGYRGDDALRPLDKVGRAQAESWVPLGNCFAPTALYSSPVTRCVDTIGPLAEQLDLSIAREPLLSEDGYRANPAAALERVDAIAAAHADDPGAVPLLCSQGKVIPFLLRTWADRDGITLPKARNRKGSGWILNLVGGKLIAADHLDSPLPQLR